MTISSGYGIWFEIQTICGTISKHPYVDPHIASIRSYIVARIWVHAYDHMCTVRIWMHAYDHMSVPICVQDHVSANNMYPNHICEHTYGYTHMITLYDHIHANHM